MAVSQRRTRTPHRERSFDLRATAMFFALLAVLVCIVGWLGRAVLHVLERQLVWGAVLVVLGVAGAVACGRGGRRFSAARLARRTGTALQEATTTALDALETEHADPAPHTVGDTDAAPMSPRAVDAREVPAGAPADTTEPTRLLRGEAGAPRVVDHYALSPAEFEQAIAALCAREGCTEVQVVGGAGDLGADVVATTADGRRVVIQCKRYDDDHKVGSQDLQRFGGTCFTVHEADVAVVVTTSDFTAPATEYAEQCGIVCVGRRELRGWSDGSMAAPWTGCAHRADGGDTPPQ